MKISICICHDLVVIREVGFLLVTRFTVLFKFVITTISLSLFHNLQFTTARTKYSESAFSSAAFWCRVSTANVPFSLESRTVPVPQPHQLLTHSVINWNSTPIGIFSNSLLRWSIPTITLLLELLPTELLQVNHCWLNMCEHVLGKWSCEVRILNAYWSLKSRYDWRSAGQSVSQSVSTFWCKAHCGTCAQILILSEFYCLVSAERPIWWEVGSVCCQSLSTVIVHRQVFAFFYFTYHKFYVHIICAMPSQPSLSTADYAPSFVAYTTTAV
jgi:hypothetical protein